MSQAEPDTASRLMSSATAAFARRGFHGTTTRDIADRAGLSPAALYVHFRSKEDMLFALSSHAHAALLDMVTEEVRRDAPPAQRMSRLVERFVEFHVGHRDLARVANNELGALSEDHREHIMGLRLAIDEAVRSVIDDGVADGSFTCPNPSLARMAILSLGIDAGRWYHPGGTSALEDAPRGYAEMSLRLLRSP